MSPFDALALAQGRKWIQDPQSKVDDFAKSHQRAPGGAPESMTGIVSH